jgi:uncharacterized protein
MPFSKPLSLLIFIGLTVALTASCHTKESATTARALDLATAKPDHNRQSIRDSLPQQRGVINDFENLYSDAEEAVLDSLVTDVEKKTTVQIAVVTLDTTLTTKEDFDAFTLKLANDWGVGKNNNNRGVVIGISKGHRKLRIQNGFGIEAILTDEETKQIVDTAFIPGFREGNYYQGTVNGINALLHKLSKNGPKN